MRCFGLPLYNAFTREALAARLGLLPFSAIIDNVRFWPKAAMGRCTAHVLCVPKTLSRLMRRGNKHFCLEIA